MVGGDPLRRLVTLDVDRARTFIDWPLCWYHGGACLDRTDIAAALLAIQAGAARPATEINDRQVTHANKRWHALRVAHFVLRSEEIRGIVLHFGARTHRVADGRHRYAAALYLGLRVIPHVWITGSGGQRYFASADPVRSAPPP